MQPRMLPASPKTQIQIIEKATADSPTVAIDLRFSTPRVAMAMGREDVTYFHPANLLDNFPDIITHRS